MYRLKDLAFRKLNYNLIFNLGLLNTKFEFVVSRVTITGTLDLTFT